MDSSQAVFANKSRMKKIDSKYDACENAGKLLHTFTVYSKQRKYMDMGRPVHLKIVVLLSVPREKIVSVNVIF